MTSSISIPPPRISVHNKYIVWTRKWQYTIFPNRHFKDALWHCLEEWNLFIGFDSTPLKERLFKREEVVYDGHRTISYCLLGITIGSSYTYQSESLQTKDFTDA